MVRGAYVHVRRFIRDTALENQLKVADIKEQKLLCFHRCLVVKECFCHPSACGRTRVAALVIQFLFLFTRHNPEHRGEVQLSRAAEQSYL